MISVCLEDWFCPKYTRAVNCPGHSTGVMVPADKKRLEKARGLTVVPIGPGQYKVGAHYVDMAGETPCHCADALRTTPQPEACKHVLACLLHEGRLP